MRPKGPIGPKGPRRSDGGRRRTAAAGVPPPGGRQAETPEHASEGNPGHASQTSQLHYLV